MGEPADLALRVGPFLETVGRHARQLYDPGGVGDERPYRRRRLGEMSFLAVAVHGFHYRFLCPPSAI